MIDPIKITKIEKIADNEIFKLIDMEDVKQFEYMVSNYGRVLSYRTDTLKSQIRDKKGYLYVTVARPDPKAHMKNLYVHRAVANEFVPKGREDQTIVNHKDGIVDHNTDTNLEYCNHDENMRHASINGLMSTGEGHPNNVYSDLLVHEICNMICSGLSNPQISSIICNKYHGLNLENVRKFSNDIRNKRSRRYISDSYF